MISLPIGFREVVAALKADPLGWYRANKLEPPSWLEETAARSLKEKAHAG